MGKRINISGQRFERLIVIGFSHVDERGEVHWKCKCDCGKYKIIVSSSLKSGRTRSCGCLQKETLKTNITGHRFGRLIAIRPSHQDKYSHWHWECKCDCGNTHIAHGTLLRNRGTRSCGCLRKEKAAITGHNGVGNKYAVKYDDNTMSQLNNIYSLYKRTAKERGYQWELSKDEFKQLIESDCYYCSAKPKPKNTSKWRVLYPQNGIDRVDNNRGYTPDNVVPCCKKCNTSKGTRTIEQFINILKERKIA